MEEKRVCMKDVANMISSSDLSRLPKELIGIVKKYLEFQIVDVKSFIKMCRIKIGNEEILLKLNCIPNVDITIFISSFSIVLFVKFEPKELHPLEDKNCLFHIINQFKVSISDETLKLLKTAFSNHEEGVISHLIHRTSKDGNMIRKCISFHQGFSIDRLLSHHAPEIEFEDTVRAIKFIYLLKKLFGDDLSICVGKVTQWDEIDRNFDECVKKYLRVY
jgi:hypothetical protein